VDIQCELNVTEFQIL